MSNISFPGNYEYYLRKGQEAIDKHRLAEGLANLETAYQLESEPIVNWLIATTAFELGNYKKSLSYIEELPDFYIREENRAELYLQNLLMKKDFLSARKLIWEIQKQNQLNHEKIQNFVRLLEMQEMFYQQTQQSLIKEIKREIFELPKYPPVQQLQMVKRISELPQAELLSITKELLIDENISLMARNYLFEELVKIGIKEPVSIIAIDGKRHHLSPVEVGTFDMNRLKRDILIKLEKRLENYDPTLLNNLKEEVEVEMALLFPLAFLYPDGKAWTNSYLSEYLQEEVLLDQKIENIRNKIKQELIGFYE